MFYLFAFWFTLFIIWSLKCNLTVSGTQLWNLCHWPLRVLSLFQTNESSLVSLSSFCLCARVLCVWMCAFVSVVSTVLARKRGAPSRTYPGGVCLRRLGGRHHQQDISDLQCSSGTVTQAGQNSSAHSFVSRIIRNAWHVPSLLVSLKLVCLVWAPCCEHNSQFIQWLHTWHIPLRAGLSVQAVHRPCALCS